MKNLILILFITLSLSSCKEKINSNNNFIVGEWKVKKPINEQAEGISFKFRKVKDSLYSLVIFNKGIELGKEYGKYNIELHKDGFLGDKEFVIEKNKFYLSKNLTLIELIKI